MGQALVLRSVCLWVLWVLGVLRGVLWVGWVLLWVSRVSCVSRVLGVSSVLGVPRVLRVLLMGLVVLAVPVLVVLVMVVVLVVLIVLVVGAAVRREVLRMGRDVSRVGLSRVSLGGVGQGHLAAAGVLVVVGVVVVGLVVGEAVLGADGAARGVLIGAGRVRLLGRVGRKPHETLLAEGLLKDRLVKAAEGGTEIFEVGEEELLVSLGHVVLGLRWLLQTQRLRHGLRVTAHGCVAVHAAHAVEVDRGQALV